MKTYAQQTIDIFDRLGASAQLSLLRFAKFLEADENGGDYLPYDEAEMGEDIALYDKAEANDDGYRISSDDLRKKLVGSVCFLVIPIQLPMKAKQL